MQTLYINTATLEHPLTLRQVRQAAPNVSLPRNPDDEALAPLGYAVVHPTERPDGDVVTQGQPELVNGTWHQTWEVREFTADELATRLGEQKSDKHDELSSDRDAAFGEGMPYTFEAGDDLVQTRPQDQVNLLALNAKAQRQVAAGDETPMPLRGESNITHLVSPAEMDALTMAALAHIEGVYAKSWQLKDAVDAAQTAEEVAAIVWHDEVAEESVSAA